jgi:hypothetical protein
VYLESKLTAEPKSTTVTRTFITVPQEKLKTYAGVYPLPQISQTLVVVAEGGKLLAAGPIQPPVEMKPLSTSHFYVEQLSADIDFSPKPDGSMKVKITQPSAVNEGQRIEMAKADLDLTPYTGIYWSEELETQYTFSAINGKLTPTHIRHGDTNLVATSKDSFSTSWWFAPNVEFLRDKDGKITAVNLGGGRTRAVRFVKK